MRVESTCDLPAYSPCGHGQTTTWFRVLADRLLRTTAARQVEQKEVEILAADQIGPALARIEGHPLYPIAVLALATGDAQR